MAIYKLRNSVSMYKYRHLKGHQTAEENEYILWGIMYHDLCLQTVVTVLEFMYTDSGVLINNDLCAQTVGYYLS